MCGEIDRLAVTDVAAADDDSLRGELVDLVAMANRCHAEMLRRVDAFDARGLSQADGFRTTRAWLAGALGVAPAAAGRLVKAARVLRQLPRLSATVQSGQVPPEHVDVVARLADRVGAERLVEGDAGLADAAQVLDLGRFRQVCQRVEAHLDPDGADPAAVFERRGVTLSPSGELTSIRGLLDPEGAAAVQTALDALMGPPAGDDPRSAAQRRADALVELARLPLAAGELPVVGGQRPQVGVLVWPQALSPETLAALAEAQADQVAAARLREFLDITTPDPAQPDPAQPDPAPAVDTLAGSGGRSGVSSPWWSRAGWADPPFLSWFGPVSPEVAQRIACDSDVFRVVMDPVTSMPLDVGRSHRLVPSWIRKALYARDRGCRWTGCQARAQWTDAHHLDEWVAHNGETKIHRICSYVGFIM